RIGYPQHAMHPNSMVLTLTGAGLLWFGWFGFNGGSALHANGQAASALTASQIAAAAAALSWMVAEWLHKGKPTALGFASGLVAGRLPRRRAVRPPRRAGPAPTPGRDGGRGVRVRTDARPGEGDRRAVRLHAGREGGERGAGPHRARRGRLRPGAGAGGGAG